MHAPILRYLEAVARAGSIRQAADELGIAASAVNRQILKLEQRLGTPLFERLPQGVRLTAAGTLVLGHARASLHDYERLRAELDQLRGVVSGLVRVACLDSLLVGVLPRVIEAFHRDNAAVRYFVEATDPHLIAEHVAAGNADIGIGFDLEQHGEVTFTADIASPLSAMVRAGHPLAGEARTNFVECARFPLLFQPDTRPTRSIMDAELATAKTSSEPLLVANSLGLLKHMVLTSDAVAFYTRMGFIEELRRGTIVAVPLTESRLTRLRVGLMLPRRRSPTPAVAAMTEALGQALADLASELANP